MDFVWALIYPFRGRRWYFVLPMIAFCLIVPLFGLILAFAYGVAIIRRISQGDYDLPDNLVWRDGIHLLWCVALYILAFFFGGAVLDVVFNISQPDDETILNLFVLSIAILTSVPFFVGAIRYAMTEDVKTLLQISETLKLISQHRWTVAQFTIQALLFLIGASAAYVTAIFAIADLNLLTGKTYYRSEDNPFFLFGILFGTPIWLAVMVFGVSYMLGQLARRLDFSGEKGKRKNDLLYAPRAELEKQK